MSVHAANIPGPLGGCSCTPQVKCHNCAGDSNLSKFFRRRASERYTCTCTDCTRRRR